MNDPDVLISRLVDGCAASGDWDALQALATQSPVLWRELALAQRDHQLLSRRVAAAVAVASNVALPQVQAAAALSFQEAALARRTRVVGTWAGWAAAAALGMAFIGNRAIDTPAIDPANDTQLNATFGNAADALTRYLTQGKEDGTVIGVQPSMTVLGYVPSADGRGGDVLYERSIIERVHVDNENMYKMAKDEMGRPAAVPVQPMPIPQPATNSAKRPNYKPAL